MQNQLSIVLSATLLFGFSSASTAQQMPSMNQVDMQVMMQQVEKMQQCYSNIDETEVEALQQRGEAMRAEITALCQSGKRDRAQQQALQFARKTNDDPVIKTIQRCSEMMKGTGIMESMVPPTPVEIDEESLQSAHVCDGF